MSQSCQSAAGVPGDIARRTSTQSLFVQLGGAALFGLVVLYAAGFAPMHVLHNAAHDVRHSAVFPCH